MDRNTILTQFRELLKKQGLTEEEQATWEQIINIVSYNELENIFAIAQADSKNLIELNTNLQLKKQALEENDFVLWEQVLQQDIQCLSSK